MQEVSLEDIHLHEENGGGNYSYSMITLAKSFLSKAAETKKPLVERNQTLSAYLLDHKYPCQADTK